MQIKKGGRKAAAGQSSCVFAVARMILRRKHLYGENIAPDLI
jgi:hypothetical protein